MANLNGKVALVTGGSRGIGAGIAKRLAADGAAVVITYANGVEAADTVVEAIAAAGGKAMALKADAADAAAVISAVDQTVEAFGALDVLVNNAGILIGKPFEEATLDELDRVLAVNVRSVFVATQAALKHMRQGARIINIGSCLGDRVLLPGVVSYSATKGAVRLFTQALARELADRGITVNNVQPGPIDTDLNPAVGDFAERQIANTTLKRYGHADDIAAMVAFIAGPEAGYITGASLTVDGGTNA
jgi:3-oxoacyl-[acyl-carrier protein] reductase